jgi:hypothetical protein
MKNRLKIETDFMKHIPLFEPKRLSKTGPTDAIGEKT